MQLVPSMDHFSNYLKQRHENALSANCFIEIHIVNMMKESKSYSKYDKSIKS